MRFHRITIYHRTYRYSSLKEQKQMILLLYWLQLFTERWPKKAFKLYFI